MGMPMAIGTGLFKLLQKEDEEAQQVPPVKQKMLFETHFQNTYHNTGDVLLQ